MTSSEAGRADQAALGEMVAAHMWKRLAGRLGLFLGGVLFCLVLAELAVRLFLPPPQMVIFGSAGGTTNRAGAQEPPADPAPQKSSSPRLTLYLPTALGRRLRPSISVTISHHAVSGRTVTITTNSLGMRNPEIGAKTCTRVIFLGDSITFGSHLSEKETFVRRIESLAASRGRSLEAINAGVGGLSLADELSLFVERGLSLDPDVVVLCFYLNDVHESPGVRMIPVPSWLRFSRLARHLCVRFSILCGVQRKEAPLEMWKRWFLHARRLYHAGPGDPARDDQAFNKVLFEQFGNWGNAWTDEAWNVMKPLFVEFRRLSRLHRFKLVVVCFPVVYQVTLPTPRDFPQRRLAAVCDDLDLPLLDLLPLFRGEGRERVKKLFYDECHHTAEGNRLIAEWILRFLEGVI